MFSRFCHFRRDGKVSRNWRLAFRGGGGQGTEALESLNMTSKPTCASTARKHQDTHTHTHTNAEALVMF